MCESVVRRKRAAVSDEEPCQYNILDELQKYYISLKPITSLDDAGLPPNSSLHENATCATPMNVSQQAAYNVCLAAIQGDEFYEICLNYTERDRYHYLCSCVLDIEVTAISDYKHIFYYCINK